MEKIFRRKFYNFALKQAFHGIYFMICVLIFFICVLIFSLEMISQINFCELGQMVQLLYSWYSSCTAGIALVQLV